MQLPQLLPHAGIKDKAKKQKAQQSQLTSAVNTINRLLSRTFINTMERQSHKKKNGVHTAVADSTAAAAVRYEESNTDNESVATDGDSLSRPPPSQGDIAPSPPRRRQNGRNTTVPDANAATPRRGADSKRQRNGRTRRGRWN